LKSGVQKLLGLAWKGSGHSNKLKG
jgi:hypothetical protein